MRLVPVPSSQVMARRADALPWIVAACRRGPGGSNAGAILNRCAEGLHQLWLAEDEAGVCAAAVTGVLTDETGRRVCEWVSFAGKSPRVLAGLQEPLEAWARDQGCVVMRSYSRPAMRKVMPDAYRTVGVILEKALA